MIPQRSLQYASHSQTQAPNANLDGSDPTFWTNLGPDHRIQVHVRLSGWSIGLL